MFAKSAGILVLAAVLVFASAGQHSRCPLVTSSRWPLGQEKAWFSGKLKTLRSGDSIDQLCDGGGPSFHESLRRMPRIDVAAELPSSAFLSRWNSLPASTTNSTW
jgi:hypothetical protein